MLWVCCYKWRRQHDTCIILESGTTWVQFDSFTVCGPVLMNEEVAFCELYCQSECHHKANIVFMVSTLSYCFTFFLYLLKWMPHQKCLQTDPKCACLKVNPVISVRMIVPSGRLFSLPPNVVSWTAIAMFAFKYRLKKTDPGLQIPMQDALLVERLFLWGHRWDIPEVVSERVDTKAVVPLSHASDCLEQGCHNIQPNGPKPPGRESSSALWKVWILIIYILVQKYLHFSCPSSEGAVLISVGDPTTLLHAEANGSKCHCLNI